MFSHANAISRYICLMKRVVLVFNDPHGIIWPMIVTMQKWFTIFNLLIQDLTLPCSCSTDVGGLCIVAIVISCVWNQTSVNNQLNFIYYYHDISMKPIIKLHTKEILYLITDTMPIRQATWHPLHSYFHRLILYSQCWWYWWRRFCYYCWHCRGRLRCSWRLPTNQFAEQLTTACYVQ